MELTLHNIFQNIEVAITRGFKDQLYQIKQSFDKQSQWMLTSGWYLRSFALHCLTGFDARRSKQRELIYIYFQ
jgi:hypothetical protein